MSRRFAALCAVALPSLVAVGGCSKSSEVSEQRASQNVEHLAKLVQTDVSEVRKGLPKGAEKMAELFDAEGDPLPTKARAVLKKVRDNVSDLAVAKSTFFAVTNVGGTVLASDLESDGMAGKAILPSFPGLEKAKTDYVELVGSWDEARGVKKGDDVQWVAGTAIKKGGNVVGMYVTGWSMRRFAHHLEEQLKSDLRNKKLAETNEKGLPLVYVFVVRDKVAYPALVTPEVNLKAVSDLDLGAKAQGDAVWHAQLEITNRGFGIAAKRVKELCDTCVVAVLRSEL